ncbi:type II secretion system protein GspL [Serratia fonticola]|uniref:type II secretion system protein GspL n=1 Tax=Serratia fonticola TaxID=47917 RepID=UPI0015C5C1B9|nr:type II secretion system protein GspL [Serratia fonticola]MBC3379646.1 type II secretion system protein GspL [Serratia fonticola]NYA38846.1 type II secretion system protein GspL [Serratia fonticola]
MPNRKPREQARLILRLPSDETQPVLWYFASADGHQQGSLAIGVNGDQLESLLARYPAWVLVPASELVFHRVTLPRRARRQGLQVLPFMLEEHLATDIERLHFAILQQSGDVCDVAVVDKSLMHQWIARCERLGGQVRAMLPDVLALPLAADGWSAVSLNDQWLFRREKHAGMIVESSWLSEFLAEWSPPVIECYSAPPASITSPPEWCVQPPRDLLQLAAEGVHDSGADLRQGEFTRSSSWRRRLRPWRTVMMALTVYLLLLCVSAGLSHYRLWQQAEHWRQESVRVYQQLFPADKKVVNPRVQMQQHLQQLQPIEQAGVVAQMRQLQQLMAENSAIRFQALSYDAGRKELKVDAQAASFQALEQFQVAAGQRYQLQPGEIKQNPTGVEGRLTLGIKDE